MMEMDSRRGPPRERTDDLIRPRLIARLAARWNCAVTTLIAGPGFGKSTAVAQAVRENQLRPLGLDAWIACEPEDAEASRLVGALASVLGVEADEPTLKHAIDAIRALSPVHVALIFDDAHLIPRESTAAEMFADLVRSLPANAHLVLISRTEPAVPLARLRAQGDVIEITSEELAFTAEESQSVGGHGSAATGGWPALVRLGADASGAVVEDYIWEEVIPELDPRSRQALLAVTIAGPSDQALLDAVLDESRRIERLFSGVPLVSWLDDGRVVAHDLWKLILRPDLEGEAGDAVRMAVARALIDRGDWRRAFETAADTADWELMKAAILLGVRKRADLSLGKSAGRWLERVPEDRQSSPEAQLLRGIALGSVNSRDPAAGPAVEAATAGFRETGELRNEMLALGIHATIAFAARDLKTLGKCNERARALVAAGASSNNSLLLLEVAVCDLSGDIPGSVKAIDALPLNEAGRMRCNTMILAGRPHDAVAAGRRLADEGAPFMHMMLAAAEWFAGDPTSILALQTVSVASLAETETDVNSQSIYAALFASSAGLSRPRLGEIPLDARNSTLVALANAGLAVDAGDEKLAQRELETILKSFPLGTNGRSTAEFHRMLPLAYVLSEDVRAYMDAADLPEWQVGTREVARQFLAARNGTSLRGRALPEAPLIFTLFPLAWTIELACRVANDGLDTARLWMQYIVDAGIDVHERLRTHAGGSDPVSQGAVRLLGMIPAVPDFTLELDILGPMTLRRDGVESPDPDWRRSRVRELIAVLALKGSVGRDRLTNMIWPDMDIDSARNNLRINLNTCRKILEPDRAADAPPYVLRQSGDELTLVGPPTLTTDVAAFRKTLAAASASDREGDVERARELYAEAVALVGSGELLPGLGSWADDHRYELDSQIVAATARCGELLLADGAHEKAAALGRRAVERDPYDEQAHRLVAAALLESGDRVGARRAIERCRTALAELELEASRETEMLDRRIRSSEPTPTNRPD
jgi:DNA-binding SARP family transcriptional activator